MKKDSLINKDNMDILPILKQIFDNLTPVHQKVALYILENPGKVLTKTAAQVAQGSYTSEASVVRLCKEIGFKGFHDFKISLARNLGADNELPVPENISKNDSPWDIFNKVITAEQENLRLTVSMIDQEVFTKVVYILAKTQRIGFFAVGSSYPVIYDTYWKFSKIGVLCQIQADPGGQMIIAESLKENDVAFAVSRSGQSKTPIRALQIAKKNGATTICLTQNIKSEISKISEYNLVTSKNLKIHDVATSSRIAHLGVLDAIYSATAVMKWESAFENIKKYSEVIRIEQF